MTVTSSRTLRHAAAIATLAIASFSATAGAQTYTWNIILDGLQENPPNASPGFGDATITWNTATHMMSINLSFSGLLGPTTAAHIHAATAVAGTGNASVATTSPYFSGFPIGVTTGTYSNTLDMTLTSSYSPSYITANGGTTAGAEAALLAAMLNNTAYLNLHSQVFPGGEIRGFIPTPGVTAIMGLGGLLAARRRR